MTPSMNELKLVELTDAELDQVAGGAQPMTDTALELAKPGITVGVNPQVNTKGPGANRGPYVFVHVTDNFTFTMGPQ